MTMTGVMMAMAPTMSLRSLDLHTALAGAVKSPLPAAASPTPLPPALPDGLPSIEAMTGAMSRLEVALSLHIPAHSVRPFPNHNTRILRSSGSMPNILLYMSTLRVKDRILHQVSDLALEDSTVMTPPSRLRLPETTSDRILATGPVPVVSNRARGVLLDQTAARPILRADFILQGKVA